MADIYIPKTNSYRGSDATGTNGGSNRTVDLTNASPQAAGMSVIVDGTSLVVSTDYTLSTNTITFLNALFDTSYIEVTYFIISQTESATSSYATTLQVFDFLKWTKSIPNYPTTTTLESVDTSGTLANGSKIYLDQSNVIDNTYTISYGASASSVTALTETTHYTMDLTKSEITITTAGAALISTGNVYAEYKHNDFCTDALISDLIDRVTKDIQDEVLQIFGETTLRLREEHTGRGKFKRLYRPKHLKLSHADTQLNGALTAASTAITVDDSTGFTAADYITINKEIMLIDSVDDSTTLTLTRGQLGTTATTHSDNDWLVNVVFETSNTPVGTEPSFNVKEYLNDYSVDSNTGAMQLLHINGNERDDLSNDVFPLHGIFNRVRMTYRSGTSTIPNDIVQACILKVAYYLTLSGIARSLPEGRNGFNPTAQQALLDEYKRLLQGERQLLIDGF